MIDFSTLWQLLVSGAANGAIYAITALGFSLIFSVTNILNLAQGEFLMVGAMIVVVLLTAAKFPILLAIAAAVLVVTLIAAAFQRLALGRLDRLTPESGIIITLGGSVFLRGAALMLWGAQARSFPSFSGDRPIDIAGAAVQPQSFWLLGLTFAMVIALWGFFRFTLVGKAMLASAQNPAGARMVGINIGQMATLAFALSGAMGALTGIVMTPLTFVSYDSGFGVGLKGFVAALIGGIGSYPGALLGGLLLGVIEALSIVYVSSAYKDAITFGLLIAILLVLPNGLLGRRRG